jgi:hypothetical protein
MKSKLILPLLATLLAVGCGGEPEPAPAPKPAVEAPAPAPAAPAPAPAVAEPPPVVATPAPAPPTNGAQESFATKTATAAIPADAIGGSPVTNQADAWVRGNDAVRKYCEDNGIPFDSFYVKESPIETSGYYTMQFYGAPNNQGMYIGVRVYPDGRAEIVR